MIGRNQQPQQPQTKWSQNKQLVYNVLYELIMEENLIQHRETILQYFDQVMAQAFKKQFQYKNYEQLNIEVLEHMNQYLENIIVEQQKQLQYQQQIRKQQEQQQHQQNKQQQPYMTGSMDGMDRMNAMGFTREDIHQQRNMKISNEFERKKQEFEGALELKKPQDIDFRDTPQEDGRNIDELMEEEIKKRNSQLNGVNQFYNVPLQEAEKWIFNGRVPDTKENSLEETRLQTLQTQYQEQTVPNTLQMIGQGNKQMKEVYYNEQEQNIGIQIKEKEVTEEEKRQMKEHLNIMKQRYEQPPSQSQSQPQTQSQSQSIHTNTILPPTPIENETNYGIRLKINEPIDSWHIEKDIEVIERKRKQVSFQNNENTQQKNSVSASFLSKLKKKEPINEEKQEEKISASKLVPMYYPEIETYIEKNRTICFDMKIDEYKQSLYIQSLLLPKQYIEHTITQTTNKSIHLPLEHIHTLFCIFVFKHIEKDKEDNTIINTIHQKAYSNPLSMNIQTNSYIVYDIHLEINLPFLKHEQETKYKIELEFDMERMRNIYSIPFLKLYPKSYDKIQNRIQNDLLKNIHQYISKEELNTNKYEIIKPYIPDIYSYGDRLEFQKTKQKYKVIMKFDIQNNMIKNIQSLSGNYILLEYEKDDTRQIEYHALHPNDDYFIDTKQAYLRCS